MRWGLKAVGDARFFVCEKGSSSLSIVGASTRWTHERRSSTKGHHLNMRRKSRHLVPHNLQVAKPEISENLESHNSNPKSHSSFIMNPDTLNSYTQNMCTIWRFDYVIIFLIRREFLRFMFTRIISSWFESYLFAVHLKQSHRSCAKSIWFDKHILNSMDAL